MILGAVFTSILIDVSLALTALVVGFFGALAYFKHIVTNHLAADATGQTPEELEQAANNAERASMAVDQVRDLAKGVVSDIDQHNAVVGGISEEISAIDSNQANSGAAVAGAIAKMLSANANLQTQLEEAEQKIKNQAEELRTHETEARTDSLTKLANRRAFDQCICLNIERFRNDGVPISMILLDVDHFKQFNDVHGHQAGDEVLRAVGRTLKSIVKKTDTPCRYGGEEFAVVMPAANAAQGRGAAERIRKAIEGIVVFFEDKSFKVTASIGVAEIRGGEQAEHLIRRSDDAVYAAKEAGRNCSYWQDGLECLPINPVSEQRPASNQTGGKATQSPSARAEPDLPNETAFSEELERRVAESHRYGVSLSVMYLRIRDFLELQSKYGHAVGELITSSVAGFIKSTLREMDLLGDLEAGCFAVMLPGSSENEAKMVGKRIQTAISNCHIPMGKTPIQLEMQLGVANVETGDDAEVMLSRAKALMERLAAGLPIEA